VRVTVKRRSIIGKAIRDNYTRFDVLTEVKIQVEVFWVLMSCSVVVGYQCFAGLCCFHLHPEVIDLKHPYVLKESI